VVNRPKPMISLRIHANGIVCKEKTEKERINRLK
jgi:hypothetical protein